MRVKDLYFGEVEGSEEFKNREAIENLYYLNISPDYIKLLLNGDKRYIHGYKGTGKTSLLKLLEYESKKTGIDFFSIQYKTLRDDAEFIHNLRENFNTFKEELMSDQDRDLIILTFWKWYILSLISKKYFKPNKLDLIYEASSGIFRTIANIIDSITIIFDANGNIGFKINTKNVDTTEKSNMYIAAEASKKIKKLSMNLKENLKHKVILFFDELELSKTRSTYGIDRVLIKNLILATKELNNISQFFHIVIAVRDEVLYNLRGDEINKLRDDFGVSLTWWNTSKVSLQHNLWQMVFKKIRYSMTIHGEATSLSDSDLWKKWFPFKINNHESWKHIFHLTWARPRDFVRILNLMRENAIEMNNFTRTSYDSALKTYSESALSEISEELATIFDDDLMEKLKRIIQRLGINFMEDEFINKSSSYGVSNPESVLEEMYRVSFVGNHYFEKGSSRWRFYYRGDKMPDYSKPFEVHSALHHALGIRDRFNSTIYYDSKRYKTHQIDDKYDPWSL